MLKVMIHKKLLSAGSVSIQMFVCVISFNKWICLQRQDYSEVRLLCHIGNCRVFRRTSDFWKSNDRLLYIMSFISIILGLFTFRSQLLAFIISIISIISSAFLLNNHPSSWFADFQIVASVLYLNRHLQIRLCLDVTCKLIYNINFDQLHKILMGLDRDQSCQGCWGHGNTDHKMLITGQRLLEITVSRSTHSQSFFP